MALASVGDKALLKAERERKRQSSFEDALLDLNDKEDQEIGNETTTFSLLDFEAT